MTRPSPRAALLLLALTTTACGRKESPVPAQPEPVPAAPIGASTAAGTAAPTPTSTSAASAAPSAEPADPSADDPDAPWRSPEQQAEAETKHKAAFARARGAMKGKNYKAAIDAFNEAHQILPEDAQTMGERGYAKFLTGDLVEALIDLSAAAALKGNAKLLAQVWYNIGQVEEARGHAESARMAFAASVSLSPSKAAENKLQGKSRCAASTTNPPHPDERVVKGWLGVWDALDKSDPAAPRPKTEAAAKAAVCTEKSSSGSPDEDNNHCEEPSPFSVAASVGSYDSTDRTLVIPGEKGDFFLLGISGLLGGGCSASVSVDHELHPKVVHAKYTYRNKYRLTWAPPGGDEILECIDAGTGIIDVIYDRATGKRLVAVERTDNLSPPIKVKLLLDEGVVTVTSGGCNEKLPLTPAAAK
jgi:Flp pilus assembly protein TadD